MGEYFQEYVEKGLLVARVNTAGIEVLHQRFYAEQCKLHLLVP